MELVRIVGGSRNPDWKGARLYSSRPLTRDTEEGLKAWHKLASKPCFEDFTAAIDHDGMLRDTKAASGCAQAAWDSPPVLLLALGHELQALGLQVSYRLLQRPHLPVPALQVGL